MGDKSYLSDGGAHDATVRLVGEFLGLMMPIEEKEKERQILRNIVKIRRSNIGNFWRVVESVFGNSVKKRFSVYVRIHVIFDVLTPITDRNHDGHLHTCPKRDAEVSLGHRFTHAWR